MSLSSKFIDDQEELDIDIINSGRVADPLRRLAPAVILNNMPLDVSFIRVFISITAWQNLWNHSMTDLKREVGGGIIGAKYIDDQGLYVNIVASLGAIHALERRANVTFTHDTWIEMNDCIDSDYSDMCIIGWYHTHPGFGAFLSEDDQFIHRNFFTQPYQIAIVIDPLQNKLKLFRFENGKFYESDKLFVYIDCESSEQINLLAKLVYPEEPTNKSVKLIESSCRHNQEVRKCKKLAVCFDDFKHSKLLSKLHRRLLSGLVDHGA